jgi:hypothetical protein
VGNDVVTFKDSTGLFATDPWQWEWHHLLPREVFNADFFEINGLTKVDDYGKPSPLVDIDHASNGWMLRARDHRLELDSIHSQGWNEEWMKWAEENKGSITLEMIEEKKKSMIKDFGLDTRGFSTEHSYGSRKLAYRGAQKLALQNNAKAKAIIEIEEKQTAVNDVIGSSKSNALAVASQEDEGSSDKRAAKKRGPGRSPFSSAAKGSIFGFTIGFVSSVLAGSETPFEDSFESFDVFSPTPMGSSEIDPEVWAYEFWDNYQNDLEYRWIQRAGERVEARFSII